MPWAHVLLPFKVHRWEAGSEAGQPTLKQPASSVGSEQVASLII